MEKILTIVIPTYNMQDYLRRCLDSLIVPEEQMKQLEVLVVNDGSKDNSSAIAHEYQDKYPGTFRVIDKENGNYGSCVNRGLKEATGKYIKILDADDWFDTEALASFLNLLNNCKADVVLTDFSCYYSNHTETVRMYVKHKNQLLSFSEGMNESSHQLINIQMHAVCYKTSCFDNLDYHQTEGISYTDQEWVLLPWVNVLSLIYIPLSLYQYNLDREGQTMASDVFERKIADQFVSINLMIDKLKEITPMVDEEHLYFLQQKMLVRIESIYKYFITRRYSLEKCALLIEFDNHLSQSSPSLYRALNKIKLAKYYPCHYILRWRENGYNPLSKRVFRMNDFVCSIVSFAKRVLNYQ